MENDLNHLIPAFLAANERQRGRAMAALTAAGPEQDDGPQAPRRDQLLNQTEIAKVLRVHPTTIRRWQVPCYHLGRASRYQVDEVMEYVRSQAFRRRLKELEQLRVG
jgi:hypothetical protein